MSMVVRLRSNGLNFNKIFKKIFLVHLKIKIQLSILTIFFVSNLNPFKNQREIEDPV
jgi:hypothetical protein